MDEADAETSESKTIKLFNCLMIQKCSVDLRGAGELVAISLVGCVWPIFKLTSAKSQMNSQTPNLSSQLPCKGTPGFLYWKTINSQVIQTTTTLSHNSIWQNKIHFAFKMQGCGHLYILLSFLRCLCPVNIQPKIA